MSKQVRVNLYREGDLVGVDGIGLAVIIEVKKLEPSGKAYLIQPLDKSKASQTWWVPYKQILGRV